MDFLADFLDVVLIFLSFSEALTRTTKTDAIIKATKQATGPIIWKLSVERRDRVARVLMESISSPFNSRRAST